MCKKNGRGFSLFLCVFEGEGDSCRGEGALCERFVNTQGRRTRLLCGGAHSKCTNIKDDCLEGQNVFIDVHQTAEAKKKKTKTHLTKGHLEVENAAAKIMNEAKLWKMT